MVVVLSNIVVKCVAVLDLSSAWLCVTLCFVISRSCTSTLLSCAHDDIEGNRLTLCKEWIWSLYYASCIFLQQMEKNVLNGPI